MKNVPAAAPSEAPAELQKTHRVRRGETLAIIAKRYQISVAQLKQINKIKRARRLSPGRLLRLVALEKTEAASPFRYRVRRGDSLRTISERFGVPIKTLKQLNSLRRNKIYAGEVLKITSRPS
jgi:LysM repeat protein